MAKRGSKRRTALPDQLALWMTQQRTPLAGFALIAAASLFAAWASLAAAPAAGGREALIAALGGGVYLSAAAPAACGAALLLGMRRPKRVRRRLLRRILGAAALLLAAWGIAGAFGPALSLGGVSLAEHSLGGAVGAAFANARGAVLVALLILGGGALLAPPQARALLSGAKRGLRWAARALADHGPGAAAAIGRAIWAGLSWYVRLVWGALREIAGDLRGAIERRRMAAQAQPLPPPPAEWTLQIPNPPPPPPPLAQAQPPNPAPPAPTPPEPAAKPPKRTLKRQAADSWRLPPLDLLDPDRPAVSQASADESAQIIVDTLASFGVDARVAEINRGPSVTQFGIEPGWEIKTRQIALRSADGKALLDGDGQPQTRSEEVARTRVRVNRITRLANDLALALSAPSIRVEAPVPGRPVIGIEVPNAEAGIVALRGLLESDEYRRAVERGGLPIALGRDVRGRPVVADLAKMPHVLIAGATGSGKSVCINTIITSLLMHQSPLQLRLVLVDPKRVELTGYASVPHLALSHVVTETDEVVRVLGMVVAEMERRYRRLEACGVRNIAAYNGRPDVEQPLPYWVVVLDELADMMMAAPVEVEQQLVRLAQLARATGIHLVVATQRPSVDVVTGLIKANFPTRIAFATTSQTDARVIMDRAGAEKLLGRGDMLLMSSDSIKPRRVQGAFVSDDEIDRVIEAWTAPAQPAAQRSTVEDLIDELLEDADAAPQTRAAIQADAATDALRSKLRTALAAEPPDIVAPDARPPALEAAAAERSPRLREQDAEVHLDSPAAPASGVGEDAAPLRLSAPGGIE